MRFKIGEVCKHGSLGRQCEICELEFDLSAANAQIASLQEAIKISTRCDAIALSANKKLDDASWARIKKLEEALKQIIECNVHVDLKCGRCAEMAKAALADGGSEESK